MNSRKFNFTRLELSLDKCLGNFRYFKDRLEPSTRMLVLVKANAYGHGAVEVASMMQRAGADFLAVALPVEGVELRGAGISLPILVLTCGTDYFPEITDNTITQGLKKVQHPCRFEFIKDKNLIIDACHNPNGVQALRDNLDRYYPNQQRRFVFGALRRKDYKKMMEILFRDGDEIYLNEFSYPDACTYEELKKACLILANKFEGINVLTPDKLNILCALNGLYPCDFFNMC